MFDIDLQAIASKIPVNHDDEKEHRLRQEMFHNMDINGSGQISLAEFDTGIRQWIGEDVALLHPAVKCAFKVAKSSDGNKFADNDYVEIQEFRLLMVNLRIYIELYLAF